MPNTINKYQGLEIICYSCGRGEHPENTMEGIRHCQSVNTDFRIEMDIQMTSDQKLVLFHDYSTLRTTGVNKLIHKLSLKEVEKLNAGYHFEINNEFIYRNRPIRVPTLEQVFIHFPDAKLLLDVHTDDPIAVGLLIDLVEKYNVSQNIIVVSHYDRVIANFKTKKPEWVYGVPTNEAKKMVYSSFLFLDFLFPIQSDILMLPQKKGNINVLSKRVVNHAKNRGKKLWAWLEEGDVVKNVNSKSELEALMAIGVNGIFTDLPAKLQKEILSWQK